VTRIDYRLIGKTWFDIQNSTVRRPGRPGRCACSSGFGQLVADRVRDNLLNKKYNAEFSPGGFVFKARPRIYGLEGWL
jgi:iron complex outermembrane receptor protein